MHDLIRNYISQILLQQLQVNTHRSYSIVQAHTASTSHELREDHFSSESLCKTNFIGERLRISSREPFLSM